MVLKSVWVQACLVMFRTRETRDHVQGYHKLTTNALECLGKPNRTLPELHGCVLALSELLQNSGEFLLSWCASINQIQLLCGGEILLAKFLIVLRYWKLASAVTDLVTDAMRDTERASNAVSASAQTLVSKLSNFFPERFNGSLFNTTMKFLLQALNGTDEWRLCVDDREKIFEALTDTILVLKNNNQIGMLNSVVAGSSGSTMSDAIDDVVSTAIQKRANGEKSPHHGALKVASTCMT